MNNLLLIAKLYQQKTLSTKLLTYAGLLAAALLIPFAFLVNEAATWFPQYITCAIMAMSGLVAGSVIARVRAWEASRFVPGLYDWLVISASVLVFCLWLPYAVLMVYFDAAGEFPVTSSLGFGLVAMLLGSGYYRKSGLLLMGTFFVVVAIPQLRLTALELARQPEAEFILIIVSLSCIGILYLHRNKANQSGELIRNSTVLVQQIWHEAPWSRLAASLPIRRMSVRKAFTVAFEHSSLQAWLNTLALFGLTMGVIVSCMLPYASAGADVVAGVAIMTMIFVVFAPTQNRYRLDETLQILWLSGAAVSRRSLVFQSFLRLMRSSLRFAVVGSGMFLLLSQVINTPFRVDLLIAIIVSVGHGAVILATGLMIFPRQSDLASGRVMLFSVLIVAELYFLGRLAPQLNLQLTPLIAGMIGALYSVVVTFLAAFLTSLGWDRKRDW